MDKREALEIYLKVHRECLEHSECKDCALREVFGGSSMCLLREISYTPVATWVRKKLNSMGEKQEAKPSVPLENVGSIIIKEPSKRSADGKCKNEQESFATGDNLSQVESRLSDKIEPDTSWLNDSVKHPYHYLRGGMECIDVIKAAVRYLKPFEAYCVGNIIKYVWRYSEKNGSEDLRKAKQYLEWLIEEVEKNETR